MKSLLISSSDYFIQFLWCKILSLFYIFVNNKNIIILENEYYDISSTEIRNMVKNNENISAFVNKKVKKLIEKEYLD